MSNSTRQSLNIKGLPDFRWNSGGYASFGSEIYQLMQSLDAMFINWAKPVAAEEFRFPLFIDAQELDKIDYFSSFPHLATFAVSAANRQENLQAVADHPFNEDGSLNLRQTAPIKQVLTPAACYHFYVQLQNSTIEKTRYLTTCSQCFRREVEYMPLQRQWNFSMREIVCIGSADDVRCFLDGYRTGLERLFKTMNWPISFQNATDPFFNPSKNPKYIMQKLEPVKTEMLFDNGLSLGSLNFHRNYFGDAFNITTTDGEPVYTGCLAFGLERWMYMYLQLYGLDGRHAAWRQEVEIEIS